MTGMRLLEDLRYFWAGVLMTWALRRTNRIVELGYRQPPKSSKCQNDDEKTREAPATVV